MTSAEYWEKRAVELEEILHKSASGTSEEIEAVFQRCKKELEEAISLWYTRFAKNNSISLADAKRLLNAGELEELQWTVQEYIRYAKDNALSGQWTKQLENASAKVHISRLESILLQTQHLIEVAVAKEHDILKNAMEDWYTESYYRNWYNFEIDTGTTMNAPLIDKRKLDKILEKPWAADGKDFSSRIWSQRDKLVQELQQQMTRNCILGKNPKEAIDAISEKFDVTKKQAGNLVMTEEAAMSSRAQEDAYKYLGVRKYVFVCTLDEKTCPLCGDMDGMEFEMSDRKIGLNANPLHPRCRCTTAPAGAKIHERAARDDDGNTVMVENMTYNEWKKKRLKEAEEKTKNVGSSGSSSGGKAVEVDVKTPKDNGGKGETYQAEKIKHLKGSYSVKFEKVSGSPEITPQLAKEFSDEYDRFQEKFRKLYSVRSVEVKPYENDGIFGDYNDNSGVISIYGAGGKDGKTIISKVASDMKKSGKWSTSSPYHAFRHELGHALQKQLKESVHDHEKKLDKIEEIRKSIFDSLTGLSESDIIEMKKKKLSLYGLESDKELDEFISECVAEYCSKKPRKVARDVVNVLLNGVGD